MTAEHTRLEAYRLERAKWKKWGPYLSDRAWATVREDGSGAQEIWQSFPYEMANYRAYRWNEDGIGGLSDRNQRICFALSLWNGKDPFLKERFFGLTNLEGNHGEDVKEYYFYLDNTPTHSYMKMLYKYPQAEFPYKLLREKNQQRSIEEKEFELLDTGIFENHRYFDVLIEYAKNGEEEICIRYTVFNRGDLEADLFLLPTIWFRNTWGWGYENGPTGDEKGKPLLKMERNAIKVEHPIEGNYFLFCKDAQKFLFTENETNVGKKSYKKDAFHRYIAHKEKEAVNPLQVGTKAAAVYHKKMQPQEKAVFLLRLTNKYIDHPFEDMDAIFALRQKEADQFYETIQPTSLTTELKTIQRQAFAGLLWNKQLYYLDMEQWHKERGNPSHNDQWSHLTSFDIFSMPDKWEFPYFCGWDTAFHCIPFSLIDPDFAKRQIELLTREWYLHPNGQLPAHEWNFSDVNPPVLAWGAWRTYKIDGKMNGKWDQGFLRGVFNKLLINFTWWVNQKDHDGYNVFQGGFLGLDNISLFDRSQSIPGGGHLDQSDGTSWMAFYCIIMLRISLHLSIEESDYQDIATKFFEHFLRIAGAMTNCGGKGHSLWDREDGFFYDALHMPDDRIIPLKVRSLVGLLPLLAVETFEEKMLGQLTTFARRVDWFISKRPHVFANLTCIYRPGVENRRLLAILTQDRLASILKYMLDENEFLSPYGIRSLSKYHEKHPYSLKLDGHTHTISYIPAESDTRLFGGNSNWRGPIWFPINFLIIESLQKFHHYYGDGFKVEFPTGSKNFLNLWEVSTELSKRLIRLFERDGTGKRPLFGNEKPWVQDPHWKDLLLFPEYFHGDEGSGFGASHQTGWTALVAKLIQQMGI